MTSIDYEPVLIELKITLTNEISSQEPTNLFCLKANNKYLNADIKVMIFGQETNDWEHDFCHAGGVTHLLEIYDRFFNSGACFSYGGHFFNGFSKLQDKIIELYAEEERTVGFIWNNVIKIGRSGQRGAPSENILKWQEMTQEVIRKEVQLYSPDIVIFLSGPNYDKYISNIFTDSIFTPICDRPVGQLAKVTSSLLPAKTLRTYHPHYLWLNGFYDYLEDIESFIKK